MDNLIVGEAFPGSGDTGSMNPHKCLLLCVKTALKITSSQTDRQTLYQAFREVIRTADRSINYLSLLTLNPVNQGSACIKIVQDIYELSYLTHINPDDSDELIRILQRHIQSSRWDYVFVWMFMCLWVHLHLCFKVWIWLWLSHFVYVHVGAGLHASGWVRLFFFLLLNWCMYVYPQCFIVQW